jgi:TPR repeat protein
MRTPVAGLVFLAVSAAAAPAAAAERPWVEVRSPHFQVLTDAGEKAARDVAEQFEQIRAAFSMLGSKLRLDPAQPLTVIAARDERSLRQLVPHYFEAKGRARPGGVFLPLQHRTFVVLREDLAGEDDSGHSVLFHEYVHLLHSLNFRTLPVWLAEGLAEFYAHTTVETNRVKLGQPSPYHVALLRDRRLLPFPEFFAVDRDSPHYNEQDRVSVFYAQAWAVTHWLLLGDKGANRPRLQKFMERLDAGAGAAEAAREALGAPEELREVLDRYLLKHAFYMQTLPALRIEPGAYTTRPVTAGEMAAWRALLHVAFDRTEDARRDVAQALRLAPEASVSHEASAQLLAKEARLPEARAAAAAAIERDARSVPALMIAGHLAELPGGAGAAEAARLFEAALAAAPSHALALVALAEAKANAGAPSAETLALARRAVEAWPASLVARIALAARLAHHGDRERALAEAGQALVLATTDEERAAARMVLETIKAAHVTRPAKPPVGRPADVLASHRQECGRGDLEACVGLGEMLEDGRGAPADAAAAAALYGKACDAGSTNGCFRLGMAHEFGAGVAKDARVALALYQSACTHGHVLACTGVGELLIRSDARFKDYPRAADLFEKACQADHPRACGLLGTLVGLGRGRPQDPARAYALYARGCAGGDASSCEDQGQSHLFGRGTDQDLARAIELFEKACHADAYYGCVPLGQALNRPEVGRDYARAAKAFERACQAGAHSGCAGLAALYREGLGVPRDVAKARSLATTACENGAVEGCGFLGAMLADEAPEKAVGFFARACDGGHAYSCTHLAMHHLGGRGVPQSMARAVALLTRACDSGEGYACHNLADLARYGGTGAPDPARAAALRKKACAAGYEPACAPASAR